MRRTGPQKSLVRNVLINKNLANGNDLNYRRFVQNLKSAVEIRALKNFEQLQTDGTRLTIRYSSFSGLSDPVACRNIMREIQRLNVLHDLQIMDTSPEREFDDVALLAAQVCEAPMSGVSFFDDEKEWFKASIGLPDLRSFEVEKGYSSRFLASRIDSVVISETERATAGESHLPCGKVHSYAAVPLEVDDNIVGLLAVADERPREFTDKQMRALRALGRQLSLRLELRRTTTLLKRANAELENLSFTDHLTGLYNRRGFLVHTERQLRIFRSRRTDDSLWLIVGDLDGLKFINDEFGHYEGDQAISAAARHLSNTFRDADIIARLGGDEFAVMMLTSGDVSEEQLEQRLAATFRSYNDSNEKPYRLEMSLGIIKIEFDSTVGIEQLFQNADALMYSTKRERKGLSQEPDTMRTQELHTSFSS